MQATQEMQFLSPGVGNGNPLLYSMDRGAWRATVHGVAENWTWLSTHLFPLLLGQRDVQVCEQLSWITSWPSFLRQGSVLPCWPPRLLLCWDPSSLPSPLFTGRQGSRSGVHAAYTVEDSSGPRLIRLPCCWWRREKRKCIFFFFNFFKKWGPFLKSLLTLLQHCFCFMFWFLGQEACGILVPWPRIEPAFPALEGRVLTTGPLGKSPKCVFCFSLL